MDPARAEQFRADFDKEYVRHVNDPAFSEMKTALIYKSDDPHYFFSVMSCPTPGRTHEISRRSASP